MHKGEICSTRTRKSPFVAGSSTNSVDGFRVRVNDYGDKDRNRVRVC